MSFVYGVNLTSKVNMLRPLFYRSVSAKACEKKTERAENNKLSFAL